MLDLTSLQSELDKDDDVERGGGVKGTWYAIAKRILSADAFHGGAQRRGRSEIAGLREAGALEDPFIA